MYAVKAKKLLHVPTLPVTATKEKEGNFTLENWQTMEAYSLSSFCSITPSPEENEVLPVKKENRYVHTYI